jgi:His/Glu/Gln/Arg/opine family amino acid ABC transporter permease subunit
MIQIMQTYGSMLVQALGKTLLLTLLSLSFAMIIGLVFSLMNVGKNRVFNFFGTAYVDGVRGVPLIVLAYFIYFGVPTGIKMMGIQDFRLSAIQAGTIALAMNCGAYMAEIIRAGIESIDKGQMEASRSLGLSYVKSMRLVVLPKPSGHDSIHYQPVHHHAERYIHSVGDRIPGTDEHGQDYFRKHFKVCKHGRLLASCI